MKFPVIALLALVSMMLLTGAGYAQITINIPKIPKIKNVPVPTPTPARDVEDEPTQPTAQPSNTRADQDETPSKPAGDPNSCKGDAFFDIHNEDIDITKKEAAEYHPGLRDYYVQDFNDRQNIYLKAALSKSKRQDWMGEWKDEKMKRCIGTVLDELAVIAKKTLPSYSGPNYASHNLAEERLMLTEISDISEGKVLRSGIKEASWLIDKDSFNFPTARFKHGLVYVRYPNVDDGFCRVIYVNIIQDYAGGGTYAATYARFIKSEFAGCPAK